MLDPVIGFSEVSAESDCARRHRVLVNIAEQDWAVHFIGPDGRTRVGPWLLFENDDEVVKILRWGAISDDDLKEYHRDIKRWGCSSVNLMLTNAQLAALIERGRGWPWNGDRKSVV